MLFKLISLQSRLGFFGGGEEWVLDWFFGEFFTKNTKT